MYRVIVALLAAVLAVAEVRETETIEKTFQLGDAGSAQVMVDNVVGSVGVVGYDGNVVEMVVRRDLWADSGESLAKAKREERLEITHEGSKLILYVNGPYRCRDGGVNHRGRRHYGYESEFNFELRVPRAVKLDVKTVNEGDITVHGTTGDFILNNINGDVEMEDVAGSGRAYALNGRMRAAFLRGPSRKSYFGSLNGDVEIAFPPDLSADVRVKTFNGSVFTDYEVTSLPPRQPEKTMRRGKQVYKTDAFFGMRVGRGGPEIEFDAFNGDVRILSGKE